MERADHLGSTIESSNEEPRNPYLEGPFAPVKNETVFHDLEVVGKIPEDLCGRFLRVGSNPNPFDPEDPKTYNWFTGSGMAFGVRLEDGKARWYRNKFVRDDKINASLGLPRIPGPNQLARRNKYRDTPGPGFIDANVSNTHICAVGGRTYCFAEGGALPIEVSYELDSIARSDFGGTLAGSWTGHPHRDPDTKSLHGIAYYWQWDHASYQVLSNEGEIVKSIDVPVHDRPVIHDCAITENYAVFLDGPINFNDLDHKAGQYFPFRWDNDYPVRFAVIKRDGDESDVVWCDSPGTCIFHILNAFDLSDCRIAVDAITNTKIFTYDLSGPVEAPTKYDRYILDPKTGKTTIVPMDDHPQEMPRLDDRLIGKEHRYAYMIGRRGSSALIKHDLKNQSTETYEHGEGRVSIETVFVPRTEDSAEDDGWLMTHVIDMPTETSEMLIFHSQAIGEGPVARTKIPHQPNVGFHGNWIPDSEIAAQTR